MNRNNDEYASLTLDEATQARAAVIKLWEIIEAGERQYCTIEWPRLEAMKGALEAFSWLLNEEEILNSPDNRENKAKREVQHLREEV
jgi:hypothetical protein